MANTSYTTFITRLSFIFHYSYRIILNSYFFYRKPQIISAYCNCAHTYIAPLVQFISPISAPYHPAWSNKFGFKCLVVRKALHLNRNLQISKALGPTVKLSAKHHLMHERCVVSRGCCPDIDVQWSCGGPSLVARDRTAVTAGFVN